MQNKFCVRLRLAVAVILNKSKTRRRRISLPKGNITCVSKSNKSARIYLVVAIPYRKSDKGDLFYALFFFNENDLSLDFINCTETRLNPTYKRAKNITINALTTKKVSTTPKSGRSNFSSISPKSVVGIRSKTEQHKNFK